MLHSAPIIEAVAVAAEQHAAGVPLVVDPVLVAKGGASLLEPSAMRALATRLIARADLATPNIPEAERLTGLTISTVDDMARGRPSGFTGLGPRAVLVKGGHLESDEITDLLSHPGGIERFHARRIESRPQRTAPAARSRPPSPRASRRGLPLVDAVSRARRYLRAAIEAAPGYGAGHGPVNHGVTVSPSS